MKEIAVRLKTSLEMSDQQLAAAHVMLSAIIPVLNMVGVRFLVIGAGRL